MPRRLCRNLTIFLAPVLFVLLSLAKTSAAEQTGDWEEALQEARGQTVDWHMWGGSPAVNSFVNGFLADELKRRFDITLRQVPVKDIAEVVGKLVVEKQAGKGSDGSADLLWINGENFRTCKEHGLLHGPFAESLPNQAYVDWSKPTVANDFGTPVEGLESPWGSAQMVMIHDSKKIPDPPRSVAGLLEWIRANPGRFAYPAPPDFTGSVFVRHVFYHAAGGAERWQNDYTEAELTAAAEATYAILRELKSSLWRQGSTYPESPVRMNTLFADGEIDFSFSYHQGEASRNILDGLFPTTVRTYIFDEGTIANTHFVAIPFNARDKAGAMVVANFLLSPEAQLEKARPEVWGDFPAISSDRLPAEWRERFLALPRGPATLTDATLQAGQLPEPPSEVLIFLEKGWEQQVLKSR
ncbi:MAG TPA: ABC transporter substrate-binding protein [Desulforhopalus sp.]|nr:ABC transporter substrate-binding protein [Desulforhopalus sp.]